MAEGLLYLVAAAVIATDCTPRLPVLKSPVQTHLPTDFVVSPEGKGTHVERIYNILQRLLRENTFMPQRVKLT